MIPCQLRRKSDDAINALKCSAMPGGRELKQHRRQMKSAGGNAQSMSLLSGHLPLHERSETGICTIRKGVEALLRSRRIMDAAVRTLKPPSEVNAPRRRDRHLKTN